jgi:hypothetical protein
LVYCTKNNLATPVSTSSQKKAKFKLGKKQVINRSIVRGGFGKKALRGQVKRARSPSRDQCYDFVILKMLSPKKMAEKICAF